MSKDTDDAQIMIQPNVLKIQPNNRSMSLQGPLKVTIIPKEICYQL